MKGALWQTVFFLLLPLPLHVVIVLKELLVRLFVHEFGVLLVLSKLLLLHQLLFAGCKRILLRVGLHWLFLFESEASLYIVQIRALEQWNSGTHGQPGCPSNSNTGVDAKRSLVLKKPAAVDSIMLSRLNLVGLALLSSALLGDGEVPVFGVDLLLEFAMLGKLVACLSLIAE